MGLTGGSVASPLLAVATPTIGGSWGSGFGTGACGSIFGFSARAGCEKGSAIKVLGVAPGTARDDGVVAPAANAPAARASLGLGAGISRKTQNAHAPTAT